MEENWVVTIYMVMMNRLLMLAFTAPFHFQLVQKKKRKRVSDVPPITVEMTMILMIIPVVVVAATTTDDKLFFHSAMSSNINVASAVVRIHNGYFPATIIYCIKTEREGNRGDGCLSGKQITLSSSSFQDLSVAFTLLW